MFVCLFVCFLSLGAFFLVEEGSHCWSQSYQLITTNLSEKILLTSIKFTCIKLTDIKFTCIKFVAEMDEYMYLDRGP